MLIGAVAAGLLTAGYVPEPDRDFMIILGCGLNKDGTPTPLLKGRIDRALRFFSHEVADARDLDLPELFCQIF